MNFSRLAHWCLAATLLALAVALSLNNAIAVQRGPPEAEEGVEGVEVLTRGPLHEAFAETVSFDPQPGFVAPNEPPALLEELPPEQRPDGDNVSWIPGYWAWDDERADFLWVSGIWRELPPGRQWVPGYWGRSARGAQWTSGYWADAEASEVEYLPQPPATVEAGPNIRAPSVDHTWLPGCWIWRQNRYAWRPGYWARGQSDWDWVPAHYVWTPRGYVFVDGYYDYSVARRGVVYAPVYFSAGVSTRRGFSYSPTVAISQAVFASHLFLRPRYGHYYYGDYYGSNYASAGFSPWFSFNSSRYGYDPFYAQQRWQHRHDRGWEQNLRAAFKNRGDDESARPPRTWADQRARAANVGPRDQQDRVVATSLDELAEGNDNPRRLRPLDQEERQRFAQHEQAVRQLREERQRLEDQSLDRAAARSKSSTRSQGAKVKLPPSPIRGLPDDRLDKDRAPPKRHEAPQPDLRITPRERKPGGKSKSVQGEPRPTTSAPQAEQPRGKRNEKRAEPKPAPSPSEPKDNSAQPKGESNPRPTKEKKNKKDKQDG